MRGHDISGKRFYKQLNPVEAFAVRQTIDLRLSGWNERHPSVYPAHEVVRLCRNIVKDTSTLPFRFVHAISPARAQHSPRFSRRNTVSSAVLLLALLESIYRNQTAGDFS